jgi:hypothetical protein
VLQDQDFNDDRKDAGDIGAEYRAEFLRLVDAAEGVRRID